MRFRREGVAASARIQAQLGHDGRAICPDRTAFRSTEALRAEHPSAHIIIVTGYNEPHFRKLSNSVGAVGLICKENLAALHMMLSSEMSRTIPNKPAAEI